ncbi:NUDIX hydrolase [Candidatus Daviesbacteria bacterium]|nr:NUDIX hydrolase [Candidatus Daviesbacteria bacterium]
MKNVFYSGGFLYNPVPKKILLHKRDDKTQNNPNCWAFFGGLNEKNEVPLETFQREVKEELGIKLNLSSIYQLTDYFNPDFSTHRHVFYAYTKEVNNIQLNEGAGYGWFTLDEALKLDLTKRTRQDLLFFLKLKRKE